MHQILLHSPWCAAGKVVVDSLPENDDACTELLETLADYLPKRYPTLFDAIPAKEPSAVPYGIRNKVTDENFTNISALKGVDALMVVTRQVCTRGVAQWADADCRLVKDDFLMGRERADGKVYLVGGVIVFPGLSSSLPPSDVLTKYRVVSALGEDRPAPARAARARPPLPQDARQRRAHHAPLRP